MKKRNLPSSVLSKCRALVAAAAVGSLASAGSAQVIAAYVVQPTDVAPRIDGDLSDACWNQAMVATTYYDYSASEKPCKLATEFRMLYDRTGIYLGVTNYEEHMDRLRANHTARNDPDLWTDDCAEIYFDPAAQAIGWRRFNVNTIGVRSDCVRVAESNFNNDWRADSTQIAVRRNEKSWTIEAFFPWSDLHRTAAVGDVRRFEHVRYAFTSGAFQGVSWSPGGSGTNLDNFGYLYFAPAGPVSPEKLAAKLGERVRPPWKILLPGGGVLEYEAPGRFRVVEAEQIVADAKQTLRTAVEETRAIVNETNDPAFVKELDDLDHACGQLSAAGLDALGALRLARRSAAMQLKARELYWKGKIQLLLNQTP